VIQQVADGDGLAEIREVGEVVPEVVIQTEAPSFLFQQYGEGGELL